VALADGKVAIYGFSAGARVIDVTKALYASSNYTQLPAFATLAACRSVLNQSVDSAAAGLRASVAEQVAAACKLRLAGFGFELVSFDLTQFTIAQAAETTTFTPG